MLKPVPHQRATPEVGLWDHAFVAGSYLKDPLEPIAVAGADVPFDPMLNATVSPAVTVDAVPTASVIHPLFWLRPPLSSCRAARIHPQMVPERSRDNCCVRIVRRVLLRWR